MLTGIRLQLVLSFLTAVLGVTSVHGQQVDSSFYRAVASSIRQVLPSGLVLLDPNLLEIPSTGVRKPLPGVALEAFRAEVGGGIKSLQDVSCPGFPSPCRLLRGEAVVAVGQPQVAGDTVKIHVEVSQKSDSRYQPLSSSHYLVILVHRAAMGWQVVGRKLLVIE